MSVQKIFLSTLVVFSIIIGSSGKNITTAQPNHPLGRFVQDNLSPTDKKFLIEAVQEGQSEVELGQLALQKGLSEEVKQHGKQMVHDHTQASQKLKELAERKNIPLPSDSGDINNQIKTRLSKLSGTAFDQAYIKEMSADHQYDISLFEHQSQTQDDPDLKAWAAETLPVLRGHLQLVSGIIPQSYLVPNRL